ncbi:MAG: iron-siderophore ABC transporter substrate-binding protein [Actinomyces sp.]|uniref:iron-siderophore ABC transporter substrate-binding protein n=1 Tax=Actinomyces sp. TaxID=29317 RepID=UPI0026DBAF93|nr:iron-siderophore ABC transporter substrate-binding protein [Actinomyces sp.]MDO4242739.1 iron-siderophore ABC transporter substrate-binding protein [Actinomyces sp.]
MAVAVTTASTSTAPQRAVNTVSVSRKSFLLASLLVPAGLAVSACGSSSSGSGSPSATTGGDTGSLSVTHAFGTTEVPGVVERIACVNWGNHDVPLALGIMPVGMAKQTWGVEDDSGMLPWTKEKVDELVADGAQAPELFDETDAIAFEAVAATTPDVILAAYSGLTQEDYDTLSKIAPTIAYPTVAWGTPWREMITMDATGMRRTADGEALVAELDTLITDSLADYPQLAGKTSAFFYLDPTDTSTIGFYTTADPRTAFLSDLGMAVPPSVQTASDADPDTFYVTVASENADTLNDVDLMVCYGQADTLATLQADPRLGTIPAIKNGAVAMVGDATPLAASTNPGPLSLPWGLAQYLELIGAAADKVQ